MREDGLWTKMVRQRVSRRTLVRTGAATGVGLWVTSVLGCGGSSQPSSNPNANSGSSTPTAKDQPKYGGELRTIWPSTFSFLDPHKASGGNDPSYARLYTATLVELGEGGKLLPSLAESWTMPDAKSINFKLKPGLKFHDGTDVDAAAVKFSIERIQNVDTKATRRNDLLPIVKIDTPDPLTVNLTLDAPNSGLIYVFTGIQTGIISPTAVNKWGSDFEKHIVSAGPFQMEEYVPEVRLVLKKYENYFGKDASGNKLPYVDRVTFRVVPDPAVAFASLQSGEIDCLFRVSSTDVETIKSSRDMTLHQVKGQSLIYLNLLTTKPPLDNLDLRKAMAYAVDRDEIVKAEYAGYAAPAYTAFPSAMWAWDSTIQDYKYDPAKAKEYLAKAGYPNGIKLRACAYGTPGSYATETVTAQLKRVGIDITVDRLELVTYQTNFRDKLQYDFGFAGTPQAPDPDRTIMAFYASGGYYNPGKPNMPEIDALAAQARAVTDLNERKKVYSQLQHLINDIVHNVFLVYVDAFHACRSNIRGFSSNPDGLGDMRWAWITK